MLVAQLHSYTGSRCIMRIAYGVHGYGQGHATRAWAVLPDLLRRHDVRIFAGGNAFETLSVSFDVYQIPTLGFCYRGARASKWRTFTHNLPHAFDLMTLGATTRHVLAEFRSFVPDIVVCDCEPFTFRVAGLLSIPRIAFDHFGIMVRCRVPMSWRRWVQGLVDRAIYQFLVGRADRALVSSFYPAEPRSTGVHLVGPMLRQQVRSITPSQHSHILAYLNQGIHQLTPSVLSALANTGVKVLLYGANRSGKTGSVHFQPRCDRRFLEDLASCRAVIGTAGNQLVGEALQYGKPLLVVPESSVEQHMNADAIAHLSVGEWVEPRQLTTERVRSFLERAPAYAENSRRLARDGRDEAVETLDTWITELAHQRSCDNGLREAMA